MRGAVVKPIWLLIMKCIDAAGAVALDARHGEAFGNDALAGEGGVAMDQQRQHAACAASSRAVAIAWRAPCPAPPD